MSRWFGKVGFSEEVEKAPGVFKSDIVERSYKGDLIRNTRRFTTVSESTNDGITLSNQISLMADPYAFQNFHNIKYVEFMGTKWTATSADASQRPRIIIELGGVYTDGQ